MRSGSAAAGRRLLLLPLLPLPLPLLLLLSGAAGVGALSCTGDGSRGMGTTMPKMDLNLLPGTEFNISCHIDPTHPKVVGYSVHDVYFTRSEELAGGGVSRIEVPADQYEVLNNTTLLLRDRLQRRTRYNYACRLRHKTTPTIGICTNHVNIGDPPLPVEDFRCVSQNWQEVNCSWTEPFNAIRTWYRAEYRTMTLIARYWKQCNSSQSRYRPLLPGQSRRVSCIVSEKNFRYAHETFRMVVNGTNALNTSSSDFVLNTYQIVRPAAPKRLRGSTTTTTARLSVEIGHPMTTFPKPIEFDVQYTSRWDHQPQTVDASSMRFVHSSKHAKGRNSTNETLVAGLLPNTDYRFAVRMRSSMADVERHPDLWSPPLEDVLRTRPTVPAAAPRTTAGSFEPVGGAESRDVYVYWQQIRPQQQNGAGFGYCARLLRPGRAAAPPNNTTAAYALFRNVSLGRLEFSVTACNDVGPSAEIASLVVPNQQQLVPRPLPVTLAGPAGSYTLTWEQEDDSAVDHFTLFWCQHTRDRPFQCEGQLSWTRVAGGRRNHTLHLPASAEYQFAVAAHRGDSSSGMVWSRCVVLASGERPQQLDRVYVQDQKPTALTLSWRDYCSRLSTEGVRYKVYYCVSRDGVCQPGGERTAVLPAGGRRGTVRLSGLRPYTQYRVQVAMLAGDVEGQRSRAVVNRTAEDQPEPPGQLRVTALNSTALRVAWSAPDRPNGQLTRYTLLVRPDGGGDPATLASNTLSHNITSNTLSHNITGLLPYSPYQLQVLACSRAGCSPPAAGSGRTSPGRPGAMEPPRSQLVNTSAVRLSWRKPKVAGGPRPRYILRVVSEREGANTTMEEALPETAAATADGPFVAELAVPECEPGSSQRHLFWVRASVRLPSGRVAAGPWSPPTQQRCVLVSDWPTGTIVGVVVGGAVLMMFVVLLFFLLCHRTKRKLSEMRNLGVNMPAGLDGPEKAHGFPGGGDGGYGRLVSQSSGGADRTAASVSGQPLLQEELTREECDGEGSELTPAGNTDSNSCSSSATNYTDSGAESCDKGASSPTYNKFQWPAPAEPPKPPLSPYVQAGGAETAGAAPPYTKFSPYVDARAIQALVARGRSMESLPAGGAAADLSRSEPDLSAAAAGTAGPPPPYSQIGHRSSTGYVSMTSEEGRPCARLGSPPAGGGAKGRAEMKPYVALGPPPPPASAAGFPPYVLAGPPPAWTGPRPAAAAAAPAPAAGYVQHDKLQPQMELRDLAGPAAPAPAPAPAGGYVSQDTLAAGEPVLSPKKLPTVATARDPYCRVVTSHQSPPDLGPNVSMV